MTPLAAASIVLPQWLATAGAFWLIWWSAQSRDGAALRAIGLALAIAPAVLLPLLTLVVQTGQMPVSSISMMFATASFGVSALRGLYLDIWAIASKDQPGLRIGGAVIAGLLLLYCLVAVVALLLMAGPYR